MSNPLYDYETIAKWWLENSNVSEAKVKRLYPSIDLARLQRMASFWSAQSYIKLEWHGFDQKYSDPINLAYWIIHPDNDSFGCCWFREHMRDERIQQEIFCNQSFNCLEQLDPEVFERLEHLSDCWGGTGGFWITQVAFFAVRIADGRLDSGTGLSGIVG